jgi:hypothetical protein
VQACAAVADAQNPHHPLPTHTHSPSVSSPVGNPPVSLVARGFNTRQVSCCAGSRCSAWHQHNPLPPQHSPSVSGPLKNPPVSLVARCFNTRPVSCCAGRRCSQGCRSAPPQSASQTGTRASYRHHKHPPPFPPESLVARGFNTRPVSCCAGRRCSQGCKSAGRLGRPLGTCSSTVSRAVRSCNTYASICVQQHMNMNMNMIRSMGRMQG